MKAFAFTLAALMVAAPALAQEHVHDHGAAASAAPANTPPPPIDPGYAGDAFYAPGVMAAQRAGLFAAMKGDPITTVLVDRFELAARKGSNAYLWEGRAWHGSETDRFMLRTKGEGVSGEGVESAELQALWSHAAGPWFNLELGVRHDLRPGPQRSYAVAGFDGLAPYWIEVEGGVYLSDKGDLYARVEANHDMRLTQKLLLQPSVEVNLAAQDVPELGIGSGLSSLEAGLRLRYELRREFAPYVGVSWEHSFGDTARYARLAGDRASTTSLVAGIRFWF